MGHQEPKGLLRTDKDTRRVFCILHPESPFKVFAKSRGGAEFVCVVCEEAQKASRDKALPPVHA